MNRFEPEEQVEELSVRSVPEENDAYIDYRKLHYKNTMPDNRVLVFLTGFCIGMVFFYLSGGQNSSAGGLLDQEHLVLMQNFEADESGLFEYVLHLRAKQLLLGVICSLSSIGGIVAFSMMGWFGFEIGLMVFSLVYQYGIKGIFLTFSMFLPHGIFYCIVFLILFRKYWTGNKKCCHKEETIKGRGSRQLLEAVKTVLLILAVFCVGILCEIYINPEIMRKIALFF